MEIRALLCTASLAALLAGCDQGGPSGMGGMITGDGGFFGVPIAFGPGRLAVAATGEGHDEVLVFEQGAEGWERRARLTAAPVADENFGSDVAMDGDLIVVGASLPRGAGKAYVFERGVDGAWGLTTTIPAPPDLENDAGFGAEVDVEGRMIVVGAPTSPTGRAFVYEQQGGGWSLVQTIRPPDDTSTHYYKGFGVRLDIEGDRLFVGASRTSSALSTGTGFEEYGALFAYRREGNAWVETGRVFGNTGDRLGTAVKTHGDLVVAGAEQYGEGGLLVVYRAADLAVLDSLTLSDAGPGERLGGFGDLAVSDGLIVAGVAFRNAPTGTTATGAAFVFTRSGDDWSLAREIQRDGAAVGEFFGLAVGLYGRDLVVGAPGYRNETGAVFEYRNLSF